MGYATDSWCASTTTKKRRGGIGVSQTTRCGSSRVHGGERCRHELDAAEGVGRNNARAGARRTRRLQSQKGSPEYRITAGGRPAEERGDLEGELNVVHDDEQPLTLSLSALCWASPGQILTYSCT